MMFGSRVNAIKDILTDPSLYKQQTLICVGLAFYVLTLITFGTAMPSGIFTPIVLSGASLGGAAGNAFQMYIDNTVSPSTFALLGVAAEGVAQDQGSRKSFSQARLRSTTA